MNLKTFRIDLPIVTVSSFTLLAKNEAEAFELINAARQGIEDAQNRVSVTHSPPLFGHSQRQIRTAEPGTPEEKALIAECIYPARALIEMEAKPNG